jgi:hypothetical protein
MAQVSNVQSRTLRVLGSLPEEVKSSLAKDVVVLEKESNDKTKTFVTAEDISTVIKMLNSNNLTFRPHFYSLFAKFTEELKATEVEKLNDKIYAIVPNAEVSYSRIDENGHTGKVVVDRFEDYNALRSFEGDVTFYKFNRTKAQSRVTGPRQPRQPRQETSGADTEGFQPVQNKRPMRSAHAESGVSSRGRAPGAGRGRGRPTQTGDRPVRDGARTSRAQTSAPKTV